MIAVCDCYSAVVDSSDTICYTIGVFAPTVRRLPMSKNMIEESFFLLLSSMLTIVYHRMTLLSRKMMKKVNFFLLLLEKS
jgi:hypothetical protein